MFFALNMTWTHCEVDWDLDFEPSEAKTCFVVVASSRPFLTFQDFGNPFFGETADLRRVSLLRKLLEHSKILKRSAGRLAKGEMMEEDGVFFDDDDDDDDDEVFVDQKWKLKKQT